MDSLYTQRESSMAFLQSSKGCEVDLCDAETKQKEYKLRRGTFEDTIYGDDKSMLEDWEECYLPEHMRMLVLGEVHHNSWDSEDTDLVLMKCEDGKIYAYDDEHLHLVAKCLESLFSEGITFPSTTVYYYGQSFEDMTEEELEEVNASEEMRQAKEHHKLQAAKWGSELKEVLREVARCYGGTEMVSSTSSMSSVKMKSSSSSPCFETTSLTGVM
ncbi:uncharacterized protein LOC134082353 isoform X2 [Sardina pilchardus]|uniref:uncharacterized protein LOC134082353 isoform X2 n=1 Tax=Sardina pilchardus TaxID=27697 RepID=UPI002E12835B